MARVRCLSREERWFNVPPRVLEFGISLSKAKGSCSSPSFCSNIVREDAWILPARGHEKLVPRLAGNHVSSLHQDSQIKELVLTAEKTIICDSKISVPFSGCLIIYLEYVTLSNHLEHWIWNGGPRRCSKGSRSPTTLDKPGSKSSLVLDWEEMFNLSVSFLVCMSTS